MKNDFKKLDKFVNKFGHDRIQDSISKHKNLLDIVKDIFNYENSRNLLLLKQYINEFKINVEHIDRYWRNRAKALKVIERICPVCSKKFNTTEKWNKITCSHSCSNTYVKFNKKRIIKIEKPCIVCGKNILVHKLKINVLCDFCKLSYKHKKNSKNFKCIKCNIPIGKTKYGFCKKCYDSSDICKEIRRKTQEKLILNGRHKGQGWQPRYKLKPSYPEQYFINLLNNENIKFKREVKVGKYFVDFVIKSKSKLIALEIDGKQHNILDRIKSDIKKDKILKENGYIVYRIKWCNPINDKNKNNLYTKIKELYNIIEHKSNFIEEWGKRRRPINDPMVELTYTEKGGALPS